MTPAVIFYSTSDIISGILTVYAARILGDFADAVFNLDFSYGISSFWKLLISIGISVVGVPIISMIGELLMFRNALKHDRLVYRRFLDQTYASAMKISEGEIQYRLEQDAIDLRCYWVDLLVKFISIPLTVVYLLYNSIQISPLFTIIVFAISLIKLTVPMAVKKIASKYDKETREYRSSVRALETEITKKPHIVKLYGLSESLIERLDKLYKNYYKTVFCKSSKYNTLADSVLSFLDIFCILLILFVGAIMVSNDIISTGAVAAMAGYFSVFNTIISNFDYIIRKTPIIKNLSDRLKVFYNDTEIKYDSATNCFAGIEAKSLCIEANSLCFDYDNNNAFNNLSFTIHNGDKVAVVGENGSGKSTLIKILCGLLKKYKGSIKINGYELNELPIENWRREFAYVEQEPYLFEGSVKENILLGNLSATDESITAIMKELGINQLADRRISTNENVLSGGEKQRISIARALLKGTDLLILDEPSNNLDENSLSWLNNFISKSSKTIIYITHDKNIVRANNYVIQL